MNERKQFNTVDEYFNAQPEKVKTALQEIRECILKVVTEAEELFNYNFLLTLWSKVAKENNKL